MGSVQRRSRPLRSGLVNLALVALPLAAAVLLIIHERETERARYEAEMVQQAQARAEQARTLAKGQFGPIWRQCTEAWREQHSLYHSPRALAWQRDSLVAHFEQGVDRSSWRRLRCDADGVQLGPRVRQPFAGSLQVEAVAEAQRPEPNDEHWSGALQALLQTTLTGDLLGVELLWREDQTVLWREWRGLEGSATAQVRGYGIPDDEAQQAAFPSLYAGLPFPMQAPSSPLPVLTGHNWLRELPAALSAVDAVLPPGALISALDIEADNIEILITGPVPDFEDDEPAMPFGDNQLDEYGVAAQGWWYPRETSGFGCAQGRSVEQLRALLASVPRPAPQSVAWYSCSTAYGDGQNGTWMLR